MAETLHLTPTTDRSVRYAELLPAIVSLTATETNAVANMANIASALRMAFGFFWVGFYLVEGDTLVLGPFQGDLACTRIPHGRGVCGVAWAEARAVLVPDVEAFPGHIACSSLSRSEVVVPIVRAGEVVGVIDVDSDRLEDFSPIDVEWLTRLAEHVATLL